jgi:hypothetical protein
MDDRIIKRVAFEDRNGNFIFVRVPEEYGRYVRTSWAVAIAPCACGAKVGEPCFSGGIRSGSRKRTGSSHADRHVAAHQILSDTGANVNSAARNSEEHPIIRDDVLHDEKTEDGVVDLREYFR